MTRRARMAVVNELVFRLGVRQRVVYLAIAGFLLLVALLDLTLGGGSGVIWLVLAGVMVGYFFWFGRFSLTLSPEGVIHRGYGTTRYTWAQIDRIEPTNFMIARRTLIRLRDGSTKRTLVPMHYWSQPDREFGRKIQTMQQWHIHFAGLPQPPGQPGPAPQPYGPPSQPYGPPPGQQGGQGYPTFPPPG